VTRQFSGVTHQLNLVRDGTVGAQGSINYLVVNKYSGWQTARVQSLSQPKRLQSRSTKAFLGCNNISFPVFTPTTGMTHFLVFFIMHNQYRNSTYHNSLSVQSTLLHVSTLSCHHHTVYSQYLAKLHTFCKLQLLNIRFIKLRCFISSLFKFLDCGCWYHNFIKLLKCSKYCRFYNKTV